MSNIKVEIINNQNLKLERGTKALIKKTCRAVLKEQHFDKKAEVCVTLVDNPAIKEINNRFRSVDKETDVLSFPLCEGEFEVNPATNRVPLGDIVISVEKAFSQAEQFCHSKKREIAYLTCHSMLHLLGFDHVNNDEEKKVMRSHEKAVMKSMKLTVKEEEEND